MERGKSEQDGGFPLTDWSRLEAVRGGNSAARNEAMNDIAERYRHPVLMYILQWGHDPEQAEDLTQDFWVKIIEEQCLAKADPGRGRFRNFLVASLKNFLKNQHRADQAKKRRPENGMICLEEMSTDDASLLLPAGHPTPDQVFQRDWRCELIRYVLSCVEVECQSQLDHFKLFREFVVLPNLENSRRPSQAELAEQYGLTEKEVANRIMTVRRKFKRLLRPAIAEYAGSEQEIEEEIKDLKLQCYIAED